ncbi:MAG: hypothetical protein ACMUEL_05935 [Flavobacteriales bacterium Tduv]
MQTKGTKFQLTCLIFIVEASSTVCRINLQERLLSRVAILLNKLVTNPIWG